MKQVIKMKTNQLQRQGKEKGQNTALHASPLHASIDNIITHEQCHAQCHTRCIGIKSCH